mgnify:CR=1 FL=1
MKKKQTGVILMLAALSLMSIQPVDYNIPSSIAGYYITQYGTETKDMESILR